MKNTYLSTICFIGIWLCSFTLAEDISEVDILQQLLRDDDERQGLITDPSMPQSADSGNLQDLVKVVAMLKGYLNQANVKSKRVFCNGLIGCMNGRKRSYPSQSLHELPVVTGALESKPKRLFCNFGGCSNFGKRSLYSTLVDRLRDSNSAQDFIDSVSDGNM